MQSHITNSLLSKIATLTKERDDLSLQVSLIKILLDLLHTNDSNNNQAVVIYHITNAVNQTLTLLTADGNINSVEIAPDLKQVIFSTIKSKKPSTYQTNTQKAIKLHPITGMMGQVDSVIAIEVEEIDAALYTSVCLILDIYQNFILLNYENECDTLTGLLNRKTFDFKINKILAHMHSGSNRKDDKISQAYFLAIFDIDHFKRINDQFGHLIGDEVLLMFSQLMRNSFREEDPLFRFGGEEFVGFFECNNTLDIQGIFKRFKQKIENFEFPQAGKVTVSIGFTEISLFDTSSQIIDRADIALYYAKNHGRNRVDSYELLIADGSLVENIKEGEIELF